MDENNVALAEWLQININQLNSVFIYIISIKLYLKKYFS